MLDLYETFYKLSADPFRLSPDHRFALGHHSYAKSKAYLEYALHRGEGFITITGGPGTGKTTLISEILAELDKTRLQVATLNSTQLESRDLLHMVAASFGVQLKEMDKATLLLGLEKFLTQQSQKGRRAVLIVDEAQGLSPGAVEELRLLANLQFNNRLLLQVFLVGQEQLRDLISGPGMEHLRQRIVAASHLETLDLDETVAYVEHRLSRVGWQGDPKIDETALRLIHTFSGGIPRRINLICSRLFLFGAMEEIHELTGREARSVIEDLQQEMLLAPGVTEDSLATEVPQDRDHEAGDAETPQRCLPRADSMNQAENPQQRIAQQNTDRAAPSEAIPELRVVVTPGPAGFERQDTPPVATPGDGKDARIQTVARLDRDSADRVPASAGSIATEISTHEEPDTTAIDAVPELQVVATAKPISKTDQAPTPVPDETGTDAVEPAPVSERDDIAPGRSVNEELRQWRESALQTGRNNNMRRGVIAAVLVLLAAGLILIIGIEGEGPVRPSVIEVEPERAAPGDAPMAGDTDKVVAAQTDKKNGTIHRDASDSEAPPQKSAVEASLTGDKASGVAADGPKSRRAAPVATKSHASAPPAKPAKRNPKRASEPVEAPVEASAMPLAEEVLKPFGRPVVKKSQDSEQPAGPKSVPPVPAVGAGKASSQTNGTRSGRQSSRSGASSATRVEPVSRAADTAQAGSASGFRDEAKKRTAIEVQRELLRTQAEDRLARRSSARPPPAGPGAGKDRAPPRRISAPAVVAKAPVSEPKKPLPSRAQLMSVLLGGQWNSRGKPAVLLPSGITFCSGGGERINCWSTPQNANTKYGPALYKVEATLERFEAGGSFYLSYRTLVKLVETEPQDREKAEEEGSSGNWQVKENDMKCRLSRPDEVLCVDDKGVKRDYQRAK